MVDVRHIRVTAVTDTRHKLLHLEGRTLLWRVREGLHCHQRAGNHVYKHILSNKSLGRIDPVLEGHGRIDPVPEGQERTDTVLEGRGRTDTVPEGQGRMDTVPEGR